MKEKKDIKCSFNINRDLSFNATLALPYIRLNGALNAVDVYTVCAVLYITVNPKLYSVYLNKEFQQVVVGEQQIV